MILTGRKIEKEVNEGRITGIERGCVMMVGDFITQSDLGQILKMEQDSRRLTELQSTLDSIFSLVEAHRTDSHYRRTPFDVRMWEAVLALKEDVR